MMPALRLRRDSVACSDLGSEVVIVDLETSVYFAARNSAAVLVTSLIDGCTVDELVERLLDRFDTSRDVARNDVEEFLGQLRARNLIEQVPDLAPQP